MIKEEIQLSILRFYDTETTDPYQPYIAICTVIWETKDIIWIKGLHGNLSRKLLRQLVQFLEEKNVRLIKTHRAASKTLPFISRREGEYAEILVSDLTRAFNKHGTPPGIRTQTLSV